VALTVGLALLAGGATGPHSTSAAVLTVTRLSARACALSGPVPGLDAAKAADADAIVAAAMAASGEDRRAAQIAVMAALTESGLANLDHGDRDSLGLFQERPSQGWGTPAQLTDPTYATDALVTRLLALPDWTTVAPWMAAQQVLRSAFPDGSNYRPNWVPAGVVVAAALGNGNTPGGCGQGTGGVSGSTGEHGLPDGYAIPLGTPQAHAAVVRFALAQLGKPYVWGAAGPASFDCSGLTMDAWETAGVTLAHYTGDQQREGEAVRASDLTPGDLVLTPGSDQPAPGIAGHVGVYLGAGLVESAIDPALGVAVQSWSVFVSGGLIALIDPAPGT
jgi:cell wall-associated NlpC family hydrolase